MWSFSAALPCHYWSKPFWIRVDHASMMSLEIVVSVSKPRSWKQSVSSPWHCICNLLLFDGMIWHDSWWLFHISLNHDWWRWIPIHYLSVPVIFQDQQPNALVLNSHDLSQREESPKKAPRRGLNSTTGSFSLAIDDGPFEEFFDDIPLSRPLGGGGKWSCCWWRLVFFWRFKW